MARRGRPKHPDVLTPREQDVLKLLRGGHSNEDIAERLGISFATAKYHVSEIIGKLGVADRHGAAAWRPDDGRTPLRLPALAPLSLLRRLPGMASPMAGAAAIVVVAVGIAALAWGVVMARGGSTKGDRAWNVDAARSPAKQDVLLFDVANRRARRINLPDAVGEASWLKPGETLLARQLDATRVATPPETNITYRVYGVDGTGIWTVPPELTRRVLPAPGGNAVLIERVDNQYIISEIPTGLGGGFLLGFSRDLSFSNDAQRVAYVTVGGSDKDNVNHDWRSVIEGKKDDLTGYSGGGLAIQSQREADGLIELPPEPWSPDNNYLLVERDGPCPPPVPDPSNCHGLVTFEVYGTQETGTVFWSAYPRRLQSVQWAGPGRLFVTFYADGERDPDYPDARSLIVDLGTQKQPAPAVFQGACCASFSPDGRYAIVAHGPDAPYNQRCSLVDAATGSELAGFDAPPGDTLGFFCGFVSWTPDGTQAIVSASPGN
jgi:DNA-binding CsgD family transcriptional regulator